MIDRGLKKKGYIPLSSRKNKETDRCNKKSEKTDISLRIITDHARCVSFLISDGVIPGNEGRSYVLRMILRRALRHGKILGMDLPFLYKLVDTVVEHYGKAYPELVQNKAKIIDTIKKEEERFNKTLDRGYKMLDEFIAEKKDIDGESAFKLYDTFGFPFELTREIAEENNLKVGDVITFELDDGTFVTHRINRIVNGEYETKGDANNTPDLFRVNYNDCNF